MTPELLVGLGVDLDGLDKGLQGAMSKFEKFGQKLENIGQKLSLSISAPLALLSRQIIKATVDFEKLELSLTAIEGTADKAKKRIKELEEVAKLPGIGFEQAIAGDVRLRAVGMAAETSKKVLQEFANAIAFTGGTAVQLDLVTYQLGQMAAKGKVLGNDLRPIIEQAPAVAGALSEMFGTVDAEGISNKLQSLGLSSTDFINLLVTKLSEIPRVQGGFGNALDNMGNSVRKFFAEIGSSLVKDLEAQKWIDAFSGKLEKLGSIFSNLDPKIRIALAALAGLSIVLPPLLIAFGMMLPALTAVGTALAGLTLPMVAVGAGVVALAALIINNWDYIKDTLIKSGLWDTLSEMALTSFGIIGGAFDVLKGIFTASGESIIKGFIGIFSSFQNLIISSVQLLMKTIGQAIEGLLKLIGANEIGRVLNTTVVGFSNILNVLKAKVPDGGLSDGIEKVKENIKTSIDKFKSFGDGVSGIGDKSEKASIEVNSLANALRNFEDAQKRANIASSENTINRLLEGSSFSKLGVEPLKKIEEVRKANEQAGQALLKSFEGTKLGDAIDKAGVNLSAGFERLKSRISEGFNSSKESFGIGVQDFQKALEYLVNETAFLIGDTMALAFGSMFSKNINFKQGFKSLLGSFLQSLGDMVMTMGVKIIATSKLLAKAMAALTALNPIVGLAAGIGLLALGAAIKGGGMAISSSANQPITSNASNVKPYMAGIGQSSVEFKIDGASLVGVLNATNRLHG